MRVLLDMDGVLAYTAHYVLETVNDEFGTNYDPDKIEHYGFDFMPDDHKKRVFELFESSDLYNHVDWVKGAKKAVDKLEKSHDVVVVTKPIMGHAQSKVAWLRKRGFDENQIVLAWEKNHIHGDVLIDDSPLVVKSANKPILIFDRPYNRHIATSNDRKRLKGWTAVHNNPIRELAPPA